jgi:hypothetical protein
LASEKKEKKKLSFVRAAVIHSPTMMKLTLCCALLSVAQTAPTYGSVIDTTTVDADDTTTSDFGSFSYGSDAGSDVFLEDESSFGSISVETETPRHIRACFSNCASMPPISADEETWCSFVTTLTKSSACLSDCQEIDFMIMEDFQSVCPTTGSIGSFGSVDSFSDSDSDSDSDSFSGSFSGASDVFMMKQESGISSSSSSQQHTTSGSHLVIGAVSVGVFIGLMSAMAITKRRQGKEDRTPDGLTSPVYRVEQQGEIYL